MPKKILLADDSVTIQKVVELTFTEGDYQVTCVSNGKQALEKIRSQRPDILLCDVIMPELNGYEVAEAVKQNPEYASIPVILLTGTFEPFDEEKARRSGAESYVTKPFDSRMLIDKVEELLRKRMVLGDSPLERAQVISEREEYSLGSRDVEPVEEELEEPEFVAEESPFDEAAPPPAAVTEPEAPEPIPAEPPPPPAFSPRGIRTPAPRAGTCRRSGRVAVRGNRAETRLLRGGFRGAGTEGADGVRDAGVRRSRGIRRGPL